MKEKPLSSIFKPGILFLLVLSGITAVILAGGFDESIEVLVYTLLFGMVAAGSANMLNNYVDRDIDAVMERTKGRPIPAGRIPPDAVLASGIVLGAAAVLLFWFFINTLSAVLALGGIIYYVLIYSLYLKSRTSQNIVIGGFAAMFPPAVGWAAVTDSMALSPLLIGLIVVAWTPPHFWALALVHKNDYKKAKIPMLPAVAGEVVTRRQIVSYAHITFSLSILLFIVGDFGIIYLAAAIILGIPFLLLALKLNSSGKEEVARALFGYSIVYLVVLFVVMIIDYFVVFIDII